MSDQMAELTEARIKVGMLQVQVDHLSDSLAALQESNQQLAAKVDQVLLALSEARGGWRTLMMVGGAASTVGAGLSWVLQHMPWRGA